MNVSYVMINILEENYKSYADKLMKKYKWSLIDISGI